MSRKDNSIYYRGGRTGILMLHGLGGTPQQMRYITRGLARGGYTVSAPQLAGHCGSIDDLRATGWKDWYASSEKALSELREDCDNVIVGGLSGGGLLALNLAAANQDNVLGTIAYSPPLKLDGWAIPWYAMFFNLIQHRWVADLMRFEEREPYGFIDKRLRTVIMQAIQSGNGGELGLSTIPGSLWFEVRCLAKATKQILGSISTPTLIIHPRDDDRASLKNTAYLQQNLGGMVETLVLDNSYHIITLDRQRETVVERTTTFADSLMPVTTGVVHNLKVQAAE